jgi:hypothetical protein
VDRQRENAKPGTDSGSTLERVTNPTDANTAEPQPERDGLSAKAWTALISVGLFVIVTTWIVASLLTARPSIDPTVYTDAIALANSQQPDPDAPSRHPELVEALTEFGRQLDRVEDEVSHERGDPGSGVKWLDFSELLHAPDPAEPDFYEGHVAGAEDARRAAVILLEQDAFKNVTALLRSPNLARQYTNALDDAGNLLPVSEWYYALDEMAALRQYAMAAVGTARALSERGQLHDAAILLEDVAPLPVVLTRRISLVEHLTAYAIAGLIANEVEHTIVHFEPDEQSLATLQRVHKQLASLRDQTAGLQGDAIYMRDIHYRTHTAGGRYIPSVTEAMMNPTSGPPTEHEIIIKLKDYWGYLAAHRDQTLALTLELNDLLIEASEESDPTKRKAMLADYESRLDALDWRHDLLLYTGDYLTPVVETWFKQQARITALGIILAMAEYRLGHDAWPETLDQLVPDYLDAVPINPLTGEPFEYDAKPDGPPSLERLGVAP